jgi:hypothetical protein
MHSASFLTLSAFCSALLVSSCSPPAANREQQIVQLLKEKMGAPTSLQSIIWSSGGEIACGYADVTKSSTYVKLVPFIVKGEQLTVVDDGPDAFFKAQQQCPKDWIAPRPVNGVS